MARYTDDRGEEKKPPTIKPRKGDGRMEEDELTSILDAVIGDAEDFNDDVLSPERAKATDYYEGQPFGNEEEGRSQFILTEVRDGVRGVLPSLLRVFFGPDHVVEFKPKNKQSVQTARLMTDAVRNKFEQSEGFLKTYAVMFDGLVRKTGAFMWGWEDEEKITEEELSGLTLEDLNAITDEEGVEVIEKEQDGEYEAPPAPPQPGPDGQPLPPAQPAAVPLYKARIKRTVKCGDVFFDAVPTDELIFSRAARGPKDALYIGRRKKITRGELLSMGYTDEEIGEHMTLGKLGISEEIDSRNSEETNGDPEAGDENDEAVYHEGYLRFDYEGDGIGVYKVCALGDHYHPLKIERADEIKFSIWSPFPRPHTLVGDSMADSLMDLQLLKSSLARGILDSLSASIFPRMAYIEGQVNPEDILNTEIGGPIRVKNTSSLANALQAVTVPFAGREGLTLLEYADTIRESRTGRSGGPDGLDQDALQSTEKAAARAAVTASQMSSEMIARMFAEMALKPLFRGIMREMARHKPDPYMIKVRHDWVEVDPRSWMSDLDVQVNVALGSATVESKLVNLDKIISRLTALMGTGPDNPIASWVELRGALAAEAELLGYQDTERFYKVVTEEQLQQAAMEAAQQPPPPSPEQMLAEGQIESKRIEVEGKLAIERDRLTLDRDIALMADDRERDKFESANILKRMEIEAVNQVKLNQQEIDAAVERDRSELARNKMALDEQKMNMDGEAAGVDAAVRIHEATRPETPDDTAGSTE